MKASKRKPFSQHNFAQFMAVVFQPMHVSGKALLYLLYLNIYYLIKYPCAPTTSR